MPWLASCAVCFGGVDAAASREAFMVTTIFMSALPLLVVGAVIGGFWWRARRQQR